MGEATTHRMESRGREGKAWTPPRGGCRDRPAIGAVGELARREGQMWG